MAEDQKEKVSIKKVAIQKEGFLAIFYEFYQVSVSSFNFFRFLYKTNIIEVFRFVLDRYT